MPGALPCGCAAPVLAMYPSDNLSDYDSRTGCLKELNELAVYHNSLLQEDLKRVQRRYPSVRVVYADFYSPVMEMVESPAKFGQWHARIYMHVFHTSLFLQLLHNNDRILASRTEVEWN